MTIDFSVLKDTSILKNWLLRLGRVILPLCYLLVFFLIIFLMFIRFCFELLEDFIVLRSALLSWNYFL